MAVKGEFPCTAIFFDVNLKFFDYSIMFVVWM